MLLASIASVASADNVWTPWADLASLRPNQDELIKQRTDRGHAEKVYEVQKIADGNGSAVNVDEYAVRISRLPTGVSRSQLFQHIRANLNAFLDQNVSVFRAHSDGDQKDFADAGGAKPGAIMVFEINNGVGTDRGAVVVSKSGPERWIFSPVADGLFGSYGDHPVAGNREFGFRDDGGGILFYTRAFDRIYPVDVALFQERAFKGADSLWKSLQANLVKYVNGNGGQAEAVPPNVPGGTDPDKKPQYAEVCKDTTLNLDC